jgi:hypothetical protein
MFTSLRRLSTVCYRQKYKKKQANKQKQHKMYLSKGTDIVFPVRKLIITL